MLAVLVVLVVGGIATAIAVLNASIEREDVTGLRTAGAAGGDEDDAAEEADRPTPVDHAADAETLHVLLLGSDSREDLTPAQRRELTTGDADGERMETIVLVRLEPGADEVRLLSIPRDSLVTRCDGSRGRVNAAYAIGDREGIGGTSCVVQTLTDWLGIEIDHTIKADFLGFVDIVDALGGVTMALDEPLSDQRAGLDLPAGCVTLDGRESLAFVRARGLDDDYGRVARQQRFVEELRREVAQMGILSDVPQTVRTVTAVANSVSLDSTLTLGRIQQLAREHRETMTAPIDGRILPGVLQTEGTAFLDVDQQRAEELVIWFETGEDPAESAAGQQDAGNGQEHGTGDGEGHGTDAGEQAPEADGEFQGSGDEFLGSDDDDVFDGSDDGVLDGDDAGAGEDGAGGDGAGEMASGGSGDGADTRDRIGSDIPSGDRCR